MLYSQVKEHKGKHLDDLMDTIRQMILIKWNQRKRVAQKFEGKILPHIVQKLRDDSYNLDIEVITSSPNGIAEICAKEREATAFRFVVNLIERTCTGLDKGQEYPANMPLPTSHQFLVPT